MTNRDERPMFSDVSANGIDAEKQSCLLEIFESAMKSITDTLVHEARFNMADFATATNRAVQKYVPIWKATSKSSHTLQKTEFFITCTSSS